MGTEVFGIKASKPGFDVVTATIQNLAIDSQYPGLKQSTFHTGSVVTTGLGGNDTWSFGLSYAPINLTYGEQNPGDGRRYLVTATPLAAPDASPINASSESTSGTFNAGIPLGINAGTYFYNTYIFLDST